MKDVEAKKGWREIPKGGVITDPGNAERYHTGGWRVKRPLWSKEKCIQCFLCWIYCPDRAIRVEEGMVFGVDYDHCKGCGICANQCPSQALEMISEDKSDINDEKREINQQKKSE